MVEQYWVYKVVYPTDNDRTAFKSRKDPREARMKDTAVETSITRLAERIRLEAKTQKPTETTQIHFQPPCNLESSSGIVPHVLLPLTEKEQKEFIEAFCA